MPILLEIVAPDREVLVSRVEEVVAPGIEGDFGVLPNHTPFLTLLRTGILWYRTPEGKRHMVVRKGYAEVRPNHVVILAEGCYLPEEITAEGAEKEIREAEEAFHKVLNEGREYDDALEHLHLAQMKRQALQGPPY